ncbi:YihY/virulence factor BrkB family protein [Desulfosporosinus lacus]|uniref:Membrane protein n=1 Tax=Desulfosporosinus lacus DSM 15449 TaxID=1121420 RepID=A0A1M5QPV3_9FIRM|nr:YihY/virulence factor BrkB family protein [Desulfosporosinus lacus]SHH15780.1 membrane protein [Desulfosporosinus lacus DSM 15449]
MYFYFNLIPLGKFIRRLVSSIIKHNIAALAAVIAFFGLSAMIPLALLLIYGASFFIPNTSVQNFLSDIVQSYVPILPDAKFNIVKNVSRLIAVGSDQVGIVGLIGLLWSTMGGFVSFQQILDMIWESRNRRSFVRQYLVGFSMLGILLSLTIITSLAATVSLDLIQRIFMRGNITFWLALFHDISRMSFPLLLFLTCYFCYRFLPTSHTFRNSYLLIGALVSTIGIYLSREVFAWYSLNLGHYAIIYGSLAFIMLFTFWVYIVCIIILFGAEVAVALRAVGE